jgi:hypothetical protein
VRVTLRLFLVVVCGVACVVLGALALWGNPTAGHLRDLLGAGVLIAGAGLVSAVVAP